ncbi:MAG: DUF126 domain-containing protein [Candidatus Heimdallarchaeota archaeon]|nr:DUF126 domain-containing protein [Candidatus Heimdallarchaeota archaeon]
MKNYIGKALRSMGDLEIKAKAIVTKEPVTFLGFVDAKTGLITQEGHELNGKSLTGKIFVFPKGVGSTVGPYTLINLVKNSKGPLAIINRESDQGTVSGCSVAQIPLAYGFINDPTEFIQEDDEITIVFKSGIARLTIH